MGYLVKAGLGLILFFGSIVVFNVKLIELMETGTCASGNQPFVVAQECPEGTGTDMLLLTGSIFAGLIGAAIFAFRGDPPWGRRKRTTGLLGLGALAWGIFFTATAVAMLYTGFSNDTVGPDGELAGKIVGFTFLVMGLPVLLIALWNQVRSMGSPRDESPAAASTGVLGSSGGIFGTLSASGGGDTIGRIDASRSCARPARSPTPSSPARSRRSSPSSSPGPPVAPGPWGRRGGS